MEDAITSGGLTLAYQPQIDLRTGRLSAVEALARWTHPQLGPIGPDEFIPLAEDTGLMPALGAWVLATSCAHAAAWRTRSSANIGLSVNVSGRQLADDTIIGTVEHALAASGLPAATLTLEITESVLMRDPYRAARDLSCTLGQGYLFARPLAADQIPSLLRTPLWLLPAQASAG